MNTTQLRCFLSVAEYLSFARASEQLNMSQPAISHQITSLENELGTKLFVRTTRTVSLTDAGQRFISDAKTIVQTAFAAINRIQNPSESSIRPFTIGLHTFLELRLLSDILRTLALQFPEVRPNLKILPAKSLRNFLETEAIDAMLSFRIETSIKAPGLFMELCQCPLVWVMSPDMAPAQKPSLSLEDLSDEKLILYETHKNPPPIAQIQNQILLSHSPESLTYTDSPESALTMVQAGLGITLLPDLMPLHFPNLVYIPLKESEIVSYGIYCKTQKKCPILKKFFSETKALFNENPHPNSF